jgi:ribosome-associated protein
MLVVNETITIPDEELSFEFARSGGPGGQNVNKVASKSTLRWQPGISPSLPEPIRARLLALIGPRLTNDGELLITSQRTRDQARNIEDCRQRLRELILRAANPPKARRATRPTLASKTRRIEAKSRRSDVKRSRRAPTDD